MKVKLFSEVFDGMPKKGEQNNHLVRFASKILVYILIRKCYFTPFLKA